MDPRAWRKREKVALRALALKLGCAWSSVRRWESGEKEAPNSIALAYEKITRGEVTSEDLARVHRRFQAEERRGKAA